MGRPSAIHEWFSIPETGRPLSYYDLLGLPVLEDQPDAIEAAFRRRLQQLEPHLNAEEQDKADRVFARLREARECLLDVKQKARYDAKLQAQTRSQVPPATESDPAKPAQPEPPSEASKSPTYRALYITLAGIAAATLLLSVGVGVIAMRMMSTLDDEPIPVASLPASSSLATPPVAVEQTTKPADAEVSPDNPKDPPPKGELPPASEPMKATAAPENVGNEEPAAAPTPMPSEPKQPIPSDTAQQLPASADAPESTASAQEVLPPQQGSPPPPPAIEDAGQRAEYIAFVREMLDKGLGKSPNRDHARVSYEKALAICPSDPRLYYGYALVLHTVQREEARKQLLTAMKQGAHPYPPAWRLLIDMELKKGIDDRLIAGLPRFAQRLEESQEPWPDAAAKTEFALFLGRVVGYCQGPGGARKRFEKELATADESILGVLHDINRKAYELGKFDIASQMESSEQNPKPSTENEKSADEDDRKLESEKQELKDNEQKLQRKKEEYDEKWNKMKVEFQRDITALEVDYKLHMENANAIQRGMAEITNSIEYTLSTVKVLNPAQQAQIEGQKAKRVLLEIELANALRQAYGVGLRAQSRIAEISRAEADYQRATGQLVKESSFIADYRKTIQVQSDRIAKQRIAKMKSEGGSAAVARFSNYAPLDIEAEKKKLVLSYQESQ